MHIDTVGYAGLALRAAQQTVRREHTATQSPRVIDRGAEGMSTRNDKSDDTVSKENARIRVQESASATNYSQSNNQALRFSSNNPVSLINQAQKTRNSGNAEQQLRQYRQTESLARSVELDFLAGVDVFV